MLDVDVSFDLSPLQAGLFVVCFVAAQLVIWCLACWVFAWYGGWRNLERRFPRRLERVHDGARTSGLFLIGERWNGEVVVRANHQGVAIGPTWPIVVGHPAIFIPWAKVSQGAAHAGIVRSYHFVADGTGVALFGKAAPYLQDAFARFGDL